jgi:oligopeptide/dipeptide ABC transporter ATP-binding protein
MTSLTPVYTVGHQIAEIVRVHTDATAEASRRQALDMMALVGIPHPESRVDDYPHQFSGGMRQRVMIAMALACQPELLIADEPTTALDVTIQAQILEVLRTAAAEAGSSIILITHDLGVVAGLADRVAVMYAGQIVEQGRVEQVFYRPRMPYTWGLLDSIARLDQQRLGRLRPIVGAPPNMTKPPSGCRFHPRCPYREARCRESSPEFLEVAFQQTARCHFAAEEGWVSPSERLTTAPDKWNPRVVAFEGRIPVGDALASPASLPPVASSASSRPSDAVP